MVGIEGSDISAIMGINKNKTAHNVFLEKIQERSTCKNYLKRESEADYWICTLKEVVAREFSLRYNKKVRKENKVWVDDEYDFIIGNIDRRVVSENSILICKVINNFTEDELAEEVSYNDVLQAHHYMRISKTEKCYIASLIRDQKFLCKEVLRDDKVIKMIVQIEKDFWFNNVLNEIEPKHV